MIYTRTLSFSLCLLALAATGCTLINGKKVMPPPLEYAIQSPYSAVTTLAIAPTINLSGSRDFDTLVVSDTLFAELQQVQNINVIPLNKTLLAMQRLGVRTIDDPKTAQKIAELLGADALVIPAVTAYDPYNPPTVGMILQLYTPQNDPAAMATPAKFTTLQSNRPSAALASETPRAPTASAQQPVCQISAIFNANNQTVLKELAVFAKGRTQYGSALQSEKFLLDADAYMRFACHAMVRRLMDVERERLSDR